MRDLLQHPFWQPGDLGAPIPDSPHAVSVCLPTWADNIGYEEDEPRVRDKLATGYPRFVHHPFTRRLFSDCVARFARPGETCIAFPSRKIAEDCQAFLHRRDIHSGLHSFGSHGIFAVNFSAESQRAAKYFWQHTGAIISSRLAEAASNGTAVRDGRDAKQEIRQRVAELAGAEVDDVYLFPSGMGAIYEVYRVLQFLCPQRKCVQFGFPYTDTIKIQEKFGCGVHFYQHGHAADLASLRDCLEGEPVMGVFCEFPSNPLLTSPDLAQLADLGRQHDVPLIIDDTVGSFHNVRVLPAADVVVSSLTKLFSGVGDVMGGALILRRDSAWYDRLKPLLQAKYEDLLCGEDAIVLAANSRDYRERAARVGQTSEQLCAFLTDHPAVETLWYPATQTPELYDAWRRPGGTCGSLFSLLLRDAPRATAAFFDALRVSKGPNLGTNFTLACPYTILAHYDELELVAKAGVSRYLIRVSIGLEDPADLQERFEQALAAI